MERYSYTALSCAEQCMLSYYNKYVAKNRVYTNTLATELGTCLHKACELHTQMLIDGVEPDYEYLKKVVMDGWIGDSKNMSGKAEVIAGVNELKSKYFEDWWDTKEGTPSYDERITTFFQHLPDEALDQEWHPIAAEQYFEVDVPDRPEKKLFGVIDRVDQNRDGQLRLVDHKSSSSIYGEKKGDNKLITPLQFFVYYLGASELYPDKEIVSCQYNFLMYGQQREAGTKGWVDRARKKMLKILDSIDEARASGVWAPSPTPLCYWCDYCKRNPNADSQFSSVCDYYSLWTPTNKTWNVAQAWTDGTTVYDIAERKKNVIFDF